MTLFLRTSLLALFGTSVLLSFAAHAEQAVCQSIPECQLLQTQVAKRIQDLRAQMAPDFRDVARDEKGAITPMTREEAIHYCQGQGAQLPSARQLAHWAIRLGAEGFVEKCESDNWCWSLETQDADGSTDSFRFSKKGFQQTDHELRKNWFWSSSVHPSGRTIAWNGRSGRFVFPSATDQLAVRCVSRD